MNGWEVRREEGGECVILGDSLGDADFVARIRLVRIHGNFGRAHSIVPWKRGAVRRIEIPTLPIFDAFTNEYILRLLVGWVSLLLGLSTFIFCIIMGKWAVVQVLPSTAEDRMGGNAESNIIVYLAGRRQLESHVIWNSLFSTFSDSAGKQSVDETICEIITCLANFRDEFFECGLAVRFSHDVFGHFEARALQRNYF